MLHNKVFYTPEQVFTHLVTYTQVQTCDSQDQIMHKTSKVYYSVHVRTYFPMHLHQVLAVNGPQAGNCKKINE